MQRKLLDSITLEESTPVWKHLMFGLPAGQLSFLARALIDSLPTPISLARWNMRISPSCPLCNQPTCTAKHVLSCCPTALHQGRFTWRHDRALRIILDFATSHQPNGQVFCDLEGLRSAENPPSTIPPEILSTSARSDIAIVSSDCITLVE